MKNFLSAVWTFFAFVGGLFLIFRFKKQNNDPGATAQNLLLKIKLKEIEAQNEVDQAFKDKSDRDIVLDAINQKSNSRKPQS